MDDSVRWPERKGSYGKGRVGLSSGKNTKARVSLEETYTWARKRKCATPRYPGAAEDLIRRRHVRARALEGRVRVKR